MLRMASGTKRQESPEPEKTLGRFLPLIPKANNQSLAVRRGSGATSRLKSGRGNYRFTPLAKIRF